MLLKYIFYIVFVTILLPHSASSQANVTSDANFMKVAAGTQYHRSKIYNLLWGKNRRKEWTTPVNVPIVLLDTLHGGLTPYEKAGGGETKSLRLRSATGKEYVLRSISKNRQGSIPGLLKNTSYATLVQDGISMSHPYGAFVLSVMLKNLGIHHTQPKLVYVPQQVALDSFNGFYANDLYLLEERAAGNWSNANHLGNFKSFFSTEDVEKKLKQENNYDADQQTFIRARLFDILIGDVDRHEGNWKWGLNADEKTFIPIPVDRDQAFFTHNGMFTKALLALTRRRFMQTFDHNIRNVKKTTLTKKDRRLDKFFTNELELEDWLAAAAFIQQNLTDNVITASIKKIPPEIFTISGNEIIEKLKYRRNNLHVYAANYYETIAKNVEVYGSAEKEYFEVKAIDKNQIAVKIFRVNRNGSIEEKPFYHRIFLRSQTKQITLNGLGGNDNFSIDKTTAGIKILKK